MKIPSTTDEFATLKDIQVDSIGDLPHLMSWQTCTSTWGYDPGWKKHPKEVSLKSKFAAYADGSRLTVYTYFIDNGKAILVSKSPSPI
jgi:hypothetical protein